MKFLVKLNRLSLNLILFNIVVISTETFHFLLIEMSTFKSIMHWKMFHFFTKVLAPILMVKHQNSNIVLKVLQSLKKLQR